jgi:exosortase A-associated hydrolase 1
MTRWQPVVIDCDGAQMMAVVHLPAIPAHTGVVVIVGGPQYRVGSHRQFLLLARRLSEAGFPCLRFDYRGMGDSTGPFAGFMHIGRDIRAAVDALLEQAPAVRRVVLWGLCDAASAALMYAAQDPRVTGLILANPWARSPQSEVRARVRHYYLRRLFSADLWKKVVRGGWKFGETVADLRAMRSVASEPGAPPYVEAMLTGAEAFRGRILLIISGEDLTAAEFLDRVRGSKRWQAVLEREGNGSERLENATHTFSSAAWRAAVERESVAWVRACNDAS